MFTIFATVTLAVHLAWILWVIGGALLTRTRLWMAILHVVSLLYSIGIELLKWPCPLTLLEQWLRVKAGVEAYQGAFIAHYLEALVYPDVPERLLTAIAVAVCVGNLAVHAVRLRRSALLR